MSSPGLYLPIGLVLVDEPDQLGVTVFVESGEVMLTVGCRDGGNVSQIMLGLTGNQTLQLIERLSPHIDAIRKVAAAGKGGRSFSPAEAKKKD